MSKIMPGPILPYPGESWAVHAEATVEGEWALVKENLASGQKWGFTMSGVPSWGPYYKGILLFGVHSRGPLYS